MILTALILVMWAVKKKKGDDDFDFNFGGDKKSGDKIVQSKEPAAASGDLLDLLGGLDMNAGSI